MDAPPTTSTEASVAVTSAATPARRRRLLAVTPLAPWPITDGFTLRVGHLLEALGAEWTITLVTPPLERSRIPASLAPTMRIEEVHITGRWRLLPSAFADSDLRARVDEVLSGQTFDAMLLWAGTEWLGFDRRDRPPTISDHVDCLTMTLLRQLLRYGTLRERLSAARLAWSFFRYERELTRKMDATVLVGADDAGFMRRLGGTDAVHVIPNGVAIPPEGAIQEAERPTVMFGGVLEYIPNVVAVEFFAERVWPMVRAELPDARFVIVGRSPAARVKALAALPGVEVLGEVDDMTATLRTAWVAVAPMRSGAGIKNKVLEAWAASRPVVMTSLATNGLDMPPDHRELIADAPAKIAATVVGLLRAPASRRAALGATARAWVVRHHSWREQAARLSALAERITGMRAARGAAAASTR